MRLLALTCGWLTGDAGLFAAGATGRLRVPVPCFLIEHPQGLVLFDSGLHAEAATAPEARLGSAASLFAVELAPHEDVGARLAALGVSPGAVRFLVTSHLHFDHTGGHATIPNAALVVQRAEWTAARDPELARGLLYDPANYDLGHEVRCVDGEHDLFGDGRVVCVAAARAARRRRAHRPGPRPRGMGNRAAGAQRPGLMGNTVAGCGGPRRSFGSLPPRPADAALRAQGRTEAG